MSIDVNSIHNIATAIADREREEHNKGKWPGSRDFVTKEQARKKAAQLTIAIIVYAVILKFLWKGLCAIGRLNRKIFGERIGKIVNIISLCLILFIPCCVICSDVDNVVDHHQNSVNNAVLITKKRNVENFRIMHSELIADTLTNQVVNLDEQLMVLEFFEKASIIEWTPDMTEEKAKEKILNAYQKSLQLLNDSKQKSNDELPSKKEIQNVNAAEESSQRKDIKNNQEIKISKAMNQKDNTKRAVDYNRTAEQEADIKQRMNEHKTELQNKINAKSEGLSKAFKKHGHYDVAFLIEAVVERFNNKLHWHSQMMPDLRSYEQSVKPLDMAYQKAMREIDRVVEDVKQKYGDILCH